MPAASRIRTKRRARGPLATSLRGHEGRDIDSMSRRILQRMCSQIDHGQLRPVDRTDSATKRLLVAARKIGDGFQIDPVCVAADDVGGMLQPTVQLECTGRLVEIETCGPHGDSDRYVMIIGLNGTRQNGARRHSSDADESLGTEDRGACIHVSLQMGVRWGAVGIVDGTNMNHARRILVSHVLSSGSTEPAASSHHF